MRTALLNIKRIRRHPSALAGALGSFMIVLTAIFGPMAAPCDVGCAGTVDRVAERFQAPSLKHPLGTDHLGTDVLSLLLNGASTSIKTGLGAAVLCTLLGTLIGVTAGFYGAWIDFAVMRIIDIVLAFPALILAILIAASLGPGSLSITLALVFSGWAAVARVIRGTVLSLKQEQFILAARSMGCTRARILFCHILPNCIPLVVVLFSMRVGMMILAESSLSFLGLGSPAGSCSWGVMVSTGRSYIGSAPWCSLAPATSIALTVLFFNFLGDGLRDLLDPRLRGRL